MHKIRWHDPFRASDPRAMDDRVGRAQGSGDRTSVEQINRVAAIRLDVCLERLVTSRTELPTDFGAEVAS